MPQRSSSLALASTLLIGVVIGCGDEPGSTVQSGSPASAGQRSSGGATGSAGSAGKSLTAGAASNIAGTSVGGSIGSGLPGEACEGLPIDVGRDSGGAAGTETGGAGDDVAAEGGAGPEPAPGDAETAESCNGVSVEAESVPVDVFVMMDRSQSMAQTVEGSSKTRWEALRDAVRSFTAAADAAEIRAGIGFFSLSGAADDTRDCSVTAYAEPRVSIGELSEIGPELVDAMAEVAPGGFTPTLPALSGAISYAQSSARDNPGRATMVVLVTDGFPTQCNSDPEQVSQAAKAGYESPEHIRTFVIGVGDVARFNLDNYARAGGTRRAYLTDAGDVTQSFVGALNNVTNRALACEYQLPPPPAGMKLDPAKVQVIYTPASGGAEEVPSISSLSACAKNANGGWYYDDPNQPSKITVCPCSCARFQAGRVDVRLGCKPRLGLR